MRIQLEVHILDDFPAAVQAALLHTLVSSMLGRTVALSGRDAAQLPEEQDELNKFHEVVREGRARLEAGKNTVSHVSRSTSAYHCAHQVPCHLCAKTVLATASLPVRLDLQQEAFVCISVRGARLLAGHEGKEEQGRLCLC